MACKLFSMILLSIVSKVFAEERCFPSLCLQEGYQKGSSPSKTEPLPVILMPFLAEVFKVKDEDSTISFGAEVVFIWTDFRIKFNKTSGEKGYRYIDQSILDHIWRPKYQIVSDTVRDQEYVTSYVNINVTSDELVLRRSIKPTITCCMRFNWYPFDEQFCDFIIQAYDPLGKVVFSSIEHNDFYTPASNENVLLDYDLNITHLPDEKKMSMLGPKFEKITPHTKRDFSWSRGGFRIHLKRRWPRYIFIYFLPSSLCVLGSWSSFLIDTENIAARSGLLATVFLSLTTLLISSIQSSPRVGFITAITVWILKEFIFILVEIAVFCHILIRKRYSEDSHWTVKRLDRRLLVLVMIAYVIVTVIYVVVMCVK